MGESHRAFQQLVAVIEELLENVCFEQVQSGGRIYYLLWLGNYVALPVNFSIISTISLKFSFHNAFILLAL
jgi:hypothetical protein